MPNKCVFVEGVEFEPLEGGNVHFTFVTGDERMRFCMSRSEIQAAAHSAMAIINESHDRQRFSLLKF